MGSPNAVLFLMISICSIVVICFNFVISSSSMYWWFSLAQSFIPGLVIFFMRDSWSSWSSINNSILINAFIIYAIISMFWLPTYMWGILDTLRRDACQSLIKDARKNRGKQWEENNEHLIEIDPEFLKQIMEAPTLSKGKKEKKLSFTVW